MSSFTVRNVRVFHPTIEAIDAELEGRKLPEDQSDAYITWADREVRSASVKYIDRYGEDQSILLLYSDEKLVANELFELVIEKWKLAQQGETEEEAEAQYSDDEEGEEE